MPAPMAQLAGLVAQVCDSRRRPVPVLLAGAPLAVVLLAPAPAPARRRAVEVALVGGLPAGARELADDLGVGRRSWSSVWYWPSSLRLSWPVSHAAVALGVLAPHRPRQEL